MDNLIINPEYERENNILMSRAVDDLIFAAKPQLITGELIVRAACNQKCEYCYLRHDNLNPPDADKNTILKNMDAILDYLYFQR